MTFVFRGKRTNRAANLVAEADLHFDEGDILAGMRLTGFAVWEKAGKISVTFPSRTFMSAGQPTYYWLLRQANEEDQKPVAKLRAIITKEFIAWRKTQ